MTHLPNLHDANIVIRTPFGNTESFIIDSLVKQGTSLGPILNDCSLAL